MSRVASTTAPPASTSTRLTTPRSGSGGWSLSTRTAGARGEFGGFGGLFRVPTDVRARCWSSSADGVGTKLKVAIEAGRIDTVGHDLVNHCVNDILAQGATPALLPGLRGVRRARSARGRRRGRGRRGGMSRERLRAARRRDGRDAGRSTRRRTIDLAGFIVGTVERGRDAGLATACGTATCSSGSRARGCTPTGTRSRGGSWPSGCGSRPRTRSRARTERRWRTCCSRSTARTWRRCGRCCRGCMRWRTSPVAGSPATSNRALPPSLDADRRHGARGRSRTCSAQLQTRGWRGRRTRCSAPSTWESGLIAIVAPGDLEAALAAAGAAGVRAWPLGRTVAGTGNVQLTGDPA